MGCCNSTIESKYEKKEVLGVGASCKVVSVQDIHGKRYAMKVMDKREAINKTLFENEKRILNVLKHPNVLEFVEAFEDKDAYNIVTVLCQGGELFDRVKNGQFTEKVAARLAREMVSAIAYCHRNNVVHRDLKPENFVFEEHREESTMKLIDFGCALIVKDDDVVPDVAGSPYYVAPEVLGDYIKRTGSVWKAADMWSVGIIIFLFVCGYPPFNGDNQERIFSHIRKGRYKFPPASHTRLSDSVKDLISKLLLRDPRQRLSAEKVLKHPWITGETATENIISNEVIKSLSTFRAHCKLKKAVGRMMTNRMTEKDREQFMSVFKQFDINGDGQLGSNEIAAMMKHLGLNKTEAQEWLKNVDDNGDGIISIDEFTTAAVVGKLGNSSNEEIKASFEIFDSDKDGFVTSKEIEKLCNFLTPEAAKQLISDVDTNGDGKINFQEWLSAMKDIDKKIPSIPNKIPSQENRL